MGWKLSTLALAFAAVGVWFGRPTGAAEAPVRPPEVGQAAIERLVGEYLAACKQVERERGSHPSHRRGGIMQIRAEIRLRVALRHTRNVAGIVIPMLDHAHRDIRRIAAKALAEIRPEEQASARIIAWLLGGKHAPVAVKALARFGPGAVAAVPALEKALYADPKLRGEICDILANVGRPAMDVLTKAIEADDPGVRAAAAQGLGRVGPSAADAAGALARLLKDKQAAVRREAADALGRVGPPAKDAAAALTGSLQDADPKVRLAAARALRRIERTAGKKAVPVLIALLRDSDAEIRQDVAWALSAHGAAARPAAGALVGMLTGHREAAKAAAMALVLIDPKPADVTGALVKALKHPRVEARVVMAEVLHHFDPSSSDLTVPVLLAALKTRYGSYEKLRAVQVLGKVGTPAVAGLMKMFDKADTNGPRCLAAMALAEIGPDAAPAADMLIAALEEPRRGDYHHHVRSSAAWAMGRIGAKRDVSVPILTLMLQDRDVRRGASEALHRLDPGVNRRHLALFVKALDRGDWWSRKDAADALGRIGPAAMDAVDALAKLELDTHPPVGAAALAAIRKIQGKALPPLSRTAEAALPGSWLSPAEALRDGYAFVAVCEAADQADVRNETGRLALATQSLAVRKALAARAQVVPTIQINYLYPRYRPHRWVNNEGDLVHAGAVPKGRRMIWVIREVPTAGALTRKRRRRAYLGVKALPDTPENRAAVVGAIKAVGSAKRLRANVKNFRMTLTCHGPKPRDCIHLTLTAAPRPEKITPLPYGVLLRHIDEKQATRIIDHLVESGFFVRADCVSPYRRTILETPRGPAYVLTVRGGAGWLFRGDLGWGLKMLARLDALRKVLDKGSDAARAMARLLKALESQRKKWEKVAGGTPAAKRRAS